MSLTRRGSAPWRPAAAEVGRWLRLAPRAALLELVSRIGFLARGVVYVSVGALALLAVLDLTPRASGATAAMALWGRWAPGVILIWLTALGLFGFSTWRFLQAIFDADDHGRRLRGLVIRCGQAISGIAHAILAWSLLQVIDGLEDLNEADELDSAQTAAAAVLAWPHGDSVLIVVGGVILAFGLGSMLQGLFQDFAKRLGCSPATGRMAVGLARLGYVGRGLAFAPMGFFLAEAGFDVRAASAHDFGHALEAVEAQPFGGAVLTLTALGLIAFGLFAFLEASFRRIEISSSSDGHG